MFGNKSDNKQKQETTFYSELYFLVISTVGEKERCNSR